MIAGAHQSCFLPWLGLLHKMRGCDVFVVLDQVQFTRGNYFNRVRLKAPDGPRWVTVPVARSFGQSIGEAVLSDEASADRLCRVIEGWYSRAAHFEALWPALRQILRERAQPGARLLELNESLMDWLCALFEIRCRRVLQSELTWQGGKNEMLVTLCRAVGADSYLSGRMAATEYLDPEAFVREGISVAIQDFEHPKHPQLHGDFAPGLSSIDLLLNCGAREAAAALSSASGGSGGVVP